MSSRLGYLLNGIVPIGVFNHSIAQWCTLLRLALDGHYVELRCGSTVDYDQLYFAVTSLHFTSHYDTFSGIIILHLINYIIISSGATKAISIKTPRG